MGLDYNGYAEFIGNNLRERGFELQQAFQIGEYSIDLFAYKHENYLFYGKTAACYLKELDRPTVEFVKSFSGTVTDHAVRYRRRFRSLFTVYSFPILVSKNFDVETTRWVHEFKGLYTATVEHPVLVELSSGRIFHRGHIPIYVGGGDARIAVRFVSKNLIPASN